VTLDHLPIKVEDKLQLFQNRAARTVVGGNYEIRSAEVLA
jgi:hypothetical protein